MYYLKSRYYDPEVCRFINADKFASTGQGILGYNMFAYCNNNPVNNRDEGGTLSVRIKIDVTIFLERLRAVLSASKKAKEIGERASISADGISFDFDSDYADFCDIAKTLGEKSASYIIVKTACAKYNQEVGYPFLLSDEGATFEYYEHVLAYEWAVGDRDNPNYLVIAWNIGKGNHSADDVFRATRSIDIRIQDITPGDSQSLAFLYAFFIRDCYIGTEYDPWRDLR